MTTRNKNSTQAKAPLIAPGKYLCRLIGRLSDPTGRSIAVELVFEVIEGEFKGVQVTGKFWQQDIIRRARAVPPGHLVEVLVQKKTSRLGKTFHDVIDFCESGTMNVLKFINGEATTEDPPEADGSDSSPTAMFTSETYGYGFPEDDYPFDESHRPRQLRVEIDGCPTPYLSSYSINAFNNRIGRTPPLKPEPTKTQAVTEPAEPDENEPSPIIRRAEAIQELVSRGLLAQGGKAGTRRIVDFLGTFRRFCRVDPSIAPTVPAHLSICQYTADVQTYQAENKGSLAGYRGPVWSVWHCMDFDAEGESNEDITRVLEQTRRVVQALVGNEVEPAKIMAFYSGNSGFHLMFPSLVAESVASRDFANSMRNLCQFVADQAERELADGLTTASHLLRQTDPNWHAPLDGNIYKPLGMLRAPNTIHEETGLYKIRLSCEELFGLDVTAIRDLARSPRPFEPPTWHHATWDFWEPIWSYCVALSKHSGNGCELSIDPAGWVHAATFEFLHNGAPEGRRAVSLFNAAVNLLQIGCSRTAVEKLLGPAAHMSGLSAQEVNSQLNGAARWVKRLRPIEISP